MEKTIGLTRARESFSDLVEQVLYKGDAYVIERRGKPVAAVVPLEVYESWKRERAALFDLIRQAQQGADLVPEEAERLAAEAVRAARS
jgi:prevent-host-death family protein